MSKSAVMPKVAVTALTDCALALTSVNLWNWATRPTSIPQRQVKDWRSYATGHRIGPSNAPVTVVVFSAYNCRYCARFWLHLSRAIDEQKLPVTVFYRHLPLDSLGLRAASVAVCATQQVSFTAISDVLFSHHDSLGALPWEQYAQAAGAVDTLAFLECMNGTEALRSVDNDIEASARLGAIGTPTFLVNRDLYLGDVWDLEHILARQLALASTVGSPTRGP